MIKNVTELVRGEGLSSLNNSYIDSIAQPFKIKGYCLLVQRCSLGKKKKIGPFNGVPMTSGCYYLFSQ